MVALAVVLVAIIFIFILCCLRPRKDGTNGFGAFKNIGQGLRPVSIESSNRYSQFINQDYVQDHTHLQGHVLVNQGYREDHKQDPVGYMQDHMQGHMQDHDHVRVKQKYMYEFDQDNTGADSTRQSWSPEHGDWVSIVCSGSYLCLYTRMCVCVCVCVCVYACMSSICCVYVCCVLEFRLVIV